MVGVADQETIAGAVITGLVAIAGTIRWSVGRIAKSSERATTAMLEFSKTSAVLSAKFDSLAARFDSLAARFDRIVDTLLRDRDRRSVRSRRADGRRRSATSKGYGGEVEDAEGDARDDLRVRARDAGDDEIDDLADERG